MDEPRLDGPRSDKLRLDELLSVDVRFDEDERIVENVSDELKELPDRLAEDAEEASDPVADAIRLVDDAAILLWTVELELEFDGEYWYAGKRTDETAAAAVVEERTPIAHRQEYLWFNIIRRLLY